MGEKNTTSRTVLQRGLRYGGSIVWIGAWIVLAYRFTASAGVFACALGAFCGLVAPELLEGRRVRRSTIAGGAILIWAVLAGSAGILRSSPLFFSVAGNRPAYALLEATIWGVTALGLTTVCEVLRRRFPVTLTFQVLFAGATLAAVLAAHRDGAQYRPYFLIDPLLLRGIDPAAALLCAGIIVGMALLIWIFAQTPGKRSQRRRAFDLAALLALLTLGVWLLPASATRKILRLAGAASGQANPKNTKGSNGGRNQDPNPENTDARQRPRPVAIVVFHNDYDPPVGDYYMRQTALSQYRDDRLAADSSHQFDRDIPDGFPTAESRVASTPVPTSQDVRTTVALLVPHSRPFGLVDADAFGPAPNPDPRRFERAYTVDSLAESRDYNALLNLTPGTPPGGAAALQHYTQAPTDPRFAGIVEQAVANLKPEFRQLPLYRAVAVKLWLDDHVTYNLKARHDGVPDPVADFLFGDLNGYCVHFAQAGALLYRTAGVPARVAEGYAVQARQRGHGSSLMIRDSDAHAWPEIYIQGAGWVVLDINPKKNVSGEPPPPDLDQQRMLGQMARNENPKNTDDNLKPSYDVRGALARWFLRALIAILALLYLGKLWRRFVVYVCRPASASRVALRAALDRMAEAGQVRRTAQTREQFSRDAAHLAPSLAPLTRLHIEEAFGAHAGRERREYLSLVRSISSELRARRPAWRIAAGWLDPFSWTLVK